MVAIVGLTLIPVLALQPNLANTQVSMRQGLVGMLYVAICLLGILAVFYPSKCKNIFRKAQNPFSQKSAVPVEIRGHHPNCQKYSPNRINVGGRAVCAACSGLLIGALVVFTGAFGYFFIGLDIAFGSIWLLVLGEVWMLLGLAQIKLAGYAKLGVNIFFVVGSFLILVETDMLGGNVFVDFYALGVIVFMLWFRILLSDWNNKRICRMCESCFQ